MPARGSTDARGYGPGHRRLRAKWDRIVQSGGAVCWRCNEAIRPGSEWVLGHVDGSGKALYRGPEHRLCSDRSGQTLSREARDPDPGPPRYRW